MVLIFNNTMKKNLLLVLLCCLVIPAFAQVTEVEYSREGYRFSMTHYDKEIVYFNDSLSVSKPIEGRILTSTTGRNMRSFDDEIGLYIYINHPKELMYERSRAFRDSHFVIVDSLFTPLNWELIDSTKQIGNYTCQLATTVCYGRKFYAWYTSEIPLDKGPWKLSGLPGLIIYAYDVDKAYEWKATKITQNVDFDFTVFPSDDKQVTQEEFITIGDELREKMIKKIKAMAAQRGLKGEPNIDTPETIEVTKTRSE